MKKKFTKTHHMDESHNRREDILSVSIYMKFKNRQKECMTAVRIIAIFGRVMNMTCCKAGNVLYLCLIGGCGGVKTHQTVYFGFAQFTKCCTSKKA